MSLTPGENGSVTLGKGRHDVCMEAIWELEALAYVLSTLASNCTPEALQFGHAVRGIAGRYVSLASVLLAALADDHEETAKLARTIYVQPYNGGD